MGEEPRREQDAAGLRNALRALYAELAAAAVGGVLSESVFHDHVGHLGLTQAERERLQDELALLGLHVRREAEHADHDERDAEKVVRAVPTARISTAHALLGRYADEWGRVREETVEGVARLAGLTPVETRELLSVAGSTRPAMPDSAVVPSPEPETEYEYDAEPELVEWEESDSAPDGTTSPPVDVARAVHAAHVVLNEDRFNRRPEKRRLTAEEEVGLAVLVRGGAGRIGERPTDEEIAALPTTGIRVRARDCLVVHNQGLAHSIAQRHGGQGLDYEDLFQQGAIGVMKAALRFDPARGYKFSTYATWWIRQSISRAIADKGAVIRIPVHLHEQIRKVAVAERKLEAEGRPWRAADVAVACDLTVSRVEEIRRVSQRTTSLDRVIGDGVHLGDLVALDRPLPSAEHLAMEAANRAYLMSLLARFGQREARILLRRTGFDGGETSTLDELGKEFGVTRERIRQLEKKAFGVLREMLRESGFGPGHAEPPDPKPRRRKAPARRIVRRGTSAVVPAPRTPHVPEVVVPAQSSLFEETALGPAAESPSGEDAIGAPPDVSEASCEPGGRERVPAVDEEHERQLDELESILLKRVDRALRRQERSLRKEADDRLAAYVARISALEERLRGAEYALARREAALQATEAEAAAQVEAVERWAAQRIAETEAIERDTHLRLAELQKRLEALAGDPGRRPPSGW
ncbi:RNA polymerase sigma factor RpoD/SigA [Streptomyces sp. NBC_00094]|uniref:sigma-70 family RNA polymerase sigma factor n=1 Tax=Streptomyces sp. NBC_00094 TaxID=2903620 RepID=UPI00225229C5|nr:sigma-70 family RNA polymerase sigma factor [Streptomyces sp. NBC_00094]MCX5393737.1 sigma-70 family RNA polymerase sigma factor [Streptomyces sp. NBC_00094]